jgi:hypothetical protein
VFEAGLCRDDPNRILRYPLHQLLFWFDLCIGWRKESTKAAERQAQQAAAAPRPQQQPVTRPFSR